MTEATVRQFEGLDILFINHGVSLALGPIETTDPAAWRKTLEVNVIGSYNCARSAVPHLKARGMVVKLAHAKAGVITVMGVPVRLHDTPGAATAPPPLLGEHTDEILTRLLRVPKNGTASAKATNTRFARGARTRFAMPG